MCSSPTAAWAELIMTVYLVHNVSKMRKITNTIMVYSKVRILLRNLQLSSINIKLSYRMVIYIYIHIYIYTNTLHVTFASQSSFPPIFSPSLSDDCTSL